MGTIRDIPNQPQWRTKYQTAWFRGAVFHVETDVRAGGRRVALHQYPKRNIPYAEDMGRTANAFQVQGYLIGPTYLDDKDILVACLEQDGPGMLRLPMPYRMSDINVMVQSYSITESRERGGFCTVEMTFVEYGDPTYRYQPAPPAKVEQSATNVENTVAGTPTPSTLQEILPYNNVWNGSGVPNMPQTGGATGSWGSSGATGSW
jgi:prophage DNA circulation protein